MKPEQKQFSLTGVSLNKNQCLINNCIAILLYLWPIISVECAPLNICLEGLCNTSAIFKDKTNRSTVYFRLFLQNECWRLDLNTGGSVRIAYNGKQITVYSQPKDKTAVNSLGIIYNGPVLYSFLKKEPSFIWMALASFNYLKQAGDQFPPLFNIDRESVLTTGYTEKANIKGFDEFPHFLEAIDLIDPAIISTNSKGIVNRIPPYSTGFTNLVYRVLQTTNVENMLIPIVFEAREQWPGYFNGIPILVANKIFQGFVTNISTIESTNVNYIADISDNIMIADYRFGGRTYIYYTTNRWLSKEEAENTKAYKHKARVEQAKNKSMTPNFKVTFAVFIAFSVILLLIYHKSKKQT